MATSRPKLPRYNTDGFDYIEKFETISVLKSPSIEPPILSPFMAVGDFLNFSGLPGCGKTNIGVDAVLAAAHPDRQGSMLGGIMRFPEEFAGKIRVAILDAENTALRWGTHLRRAMELQGLDLSRLGLVRYASTNDLGLYNQSEWKIRSEALALALAHDQVKLVIGDSLGRIWSPDDVNSTNWVQQAYVPFRIACKNYGISCIMLTHVKRGSRDSGAATGPIGTSFQEGQADAQIMVKTNAGVMDLTLRKSRRALWIPADRTIQLRFTPTLDYEPIDGWQREWPHEPDDSTVPSIKPDVDTAGQVRHLLKAAAGASLTAQDLAAEVGVCDRQLRNILADLETAGLAKPSKDGRKYYWRWCQ